MSELKCLIELNKADGISIKLKNPEGKILQTIVLNGTTIVTTCKGESETSVITQKDESIAISCKKFSVEAETIEMTSKKKTTHKSGEDMSWETDKNLSVSSKEETKLNSGKNMSLKSDKDISSKASNKIKLDSSDTDIKASSGLKMKGATADISSDTSMKIKSTKIDVSGSAKVKVSGSAMVEISGGIIKLQ